MKGNDYLVIGGIAFLVYLLLKKKGATIAGAGGSGSGSGCGCGSGAASVNPWTLGVRAGCPSSSPGNGNYAQGNGPMPPLAGTTYDPPASQAWDAGGFHLAFDLSF